MTITTTTTMIDVRKCYVVMQNTRQGRERKPGLSLITYTPGEGEKRKPFKDHEERKVGYAADKVACRWVGAVVKQANRVPCVWAVSGVNDGRPDRTTD